MQVRVESLNELEEGRILRGETVELGLDPDSTLTDQLLSPIAGSLETESTQVI